MAGSGVVRMRTSVAVSPKSAAFCAIIICSAQLYVTLSYSMSHRYHCEKTDEEFQKKWKESEGSAVSCAGESESSEGCGGGGGWRLLVMSPCGVVWGGVRSDRAVLT